MLRVFSKRFADGRTVIETVQVSFVPAMVTACSATWTPRPFAIVTLPSRSSASSVKRQRSRSSFVALAAETARCSAVALRSGGHVPGAGLGGAVAWHAISWRTQATAPWTATLAGRSG
jgi:hypothetical protein